jgi:hypothetical protein
VTSRARHGGAEAVVTVRTSFPTIETNSTVVVERRVAGGARQSRRLDVWAVSERSPQPLGPLALDPEVAPQADVLSYRRPDVHRRYVELDTTNCTGLVYEIERRPQEFVGKYDVVGSPADSNQFEVFSRQPQQAVRCRPKLGRSATGCTLSLVDDSLDLSESLVHLVLPRGQDVGVLNPVARHARRFAGHLDLLMSFDFPRQTVAASA